MTSGERRLCYGKETDVYYITSADVLFHNMAHDVYPFWRNDISDKQC